MKKHNFLHTSMALISITLNIKAAELNVTIDHVNNANGIILAHIFKGPDNFKKGHAKDSTILPGRKGKPI